jgi:hypothetical protein
MKEAKEKASIARLALDQEEKRIQEENRVKAAQKEAEAKEESLKEAEERAALVLSAFVDSVSQAIIMGTEHLSLRVMPVPPGDVIMWYPKIGGISEGDLRGTSKMVFDFLRENGHMPFIETIRPDPRKPSAHTIWAKKVK